MSTGIILASHGEFAKAALGSAEMIAGKQDNVYAFALSSDTSLETLETQIGEAYRDLSSKCDVVIALCDIYGGSPFNAISRCILKGMNMVAYTGLSLPVLIDLLLAREISADEACQHIEETHRIGLTRIEVSLQNDEDEIDL